MKNKKIIYFALSTITLCTAIIGVTSIKNSSSSDDLAIKLNNTNYKHKSIDFNNGGGQYVSNAKATIDESKNSIRFISAVKVEVNDIKEFSLPGTFGFHIEYEKVVDNGTTKINKMYDVDALYYSYSETDTNGNKTIYGSELSSYYNNHDGSSFKAVSDYIEDSSTSYNLFMTVEIRNIPAEELNSSIKVQPYCLLSDGTYDLAKETKYYSFNSLKDTTPEIIINNYKTEVSNDIPYFIINSTLKNINYDQLYLVLELQEGWPHPTYNLKVNKSTTNNDNTTNLFINLDQTIDGSSLKTGEYTISIKNDINDEQISLTNTTDSNMFKDKIISPSKSIYEFGEKYGNLKVDIAKYSDSQIINNSYRIETKDDKDYLVVNSYLFIDDVSSLKVNVTKFTSWASEDKDCTYLLLKDGSYDVYLDITNLEYDSNTSDGLYGGYFIKLVAGSVNADVKFETAHENGITSGKYTFCDQWGNLKLHIVKENTVEYNSYNIKEDNGKAILTINANINISNIDELKFIFTKFQANEWATYEADYRIEKQNDGSYNVSTDVSDLDICGKFNNDTDMEGYLVALNDNDKKIAQGKNVPETVTINGKTYSFEDLWGNLKIVVSKAS